MANKEAARREKTACRLPLYRQVLELQMLVLHVTEKHTQYGKGKIKWTVGIPIFLSDNDRDQGK